MSQLNGVFLHNKKDKRESDWECERVSESGRKKLKWGETQHIKTLLPKPCVLHALPEPEKSLHLTLSLTLCYTLLLPFLPSLSSTHTLSLSLSPLTFSINLSLTKIKQKHKHRLSERYLSIFFLPFILSICVSLYFLYFTLLFTFVSLSAYQSDTFFSFSLFFTFLLSPFPFHHQPLSIS